MMLHDIQKIAQDLAYALPARVYALTGELGAGKTTFTQFFLRALGITEPITSPTFVIIKRYDLRFKNYERAYHIDAYRLKDPHELLALGFKEITADPHAIIIIEWADRVRDLLPSDARWIHFAHGADEGDRVISFTI